MFAPLPAGVMAYCRLAAACFRDYLLFTPLLSRHAAFFFTPIFIFPSSLVFFDDYFRYFSTLSASPPLIFAFR
jgi:hypothetical protein